MDFTELLCGDFAQRRQRLPMGGIEDSSGLNKEGAVAAAVRIFTPAVAIAVVREAIWPRGL